MKKIIVVSTHTPTLLQFRWDMMRYFRDCGYEILALGEEEEEKWIDRFSEEGFRYKKIKIDRNGLNPIRDVATIRELKRIFGKEKPEKIYLYSMKSVLYGSIAASSDIEIYSLISGLGSIFRGTTTKSKILRFVLKYLYRREMKKNKGIFFHNEEDRQLFLDWNLSEPEKCVRVHGSGVNTEKFAYEKSESEETVFLMMARIIRDKGVVEYLEAAKSVKEKYPSARFLLMGRYDTNPSALKPEDVEPYLPYIEYVSEQEDVLPYLKECTVFVLPSYHEGVPKSTLEAMSVGRAVITTEAPGCRDTVIEGENGYLVPVKDADALASAMKKMVENRSLQDEMGMRSRQLVEEFYDVRIVNREIAEVMHLPILDKE